MICRLLFAFLALGLAAAQQKIVLHTNGTGGPVCGPYHSCVKDAVCVKKDGVKMCECPVSLVGNAKLVCHPPKNNTVVIQNDPHVRTFYKDVASLPSPCRYRLVHLVMKLADNVTRAVVELYGQNTLLKDGKYFLTNMTLSTQVVQGEDLMEQVINVYGDVEKDKVSYTFIAESSEPGKESFEPVSSFTGYYMDVEKDPINNLLTICIPKLGVRLFFRPASVKYLLDNDKLPFVPGAVFAVEPEYWPYVRVNESDFEISSWPQGPSLKEAAQVMGTSVDTLMQYLMLNNSLSNRVYNDDVCVKTENIFINECPTKEVRLRMLDTCSSIYSDVSFLECITKKSLAEYVPVVKENFQKCEISFCRSDVKVCEEMQAAINATGCPLRTIDVLDCSSTPVNTRRTVK